MGALIGQILIFVLLLPLVNSINSIALKRSYVNECERFWREAPVKWNHKILNNAKQLTTTSDAKKYISSLRQIWQIQGKNDADQFIAQLQLDAEFIGVAAAEYIDGEYVTRGQHGEVTYIYVIIHVELNNIVVTFSYHHINENMIGSNFVYTAHAKDITVEWLKWKAWEGVRTLAPKIVPEITWI